jgi:uracil phosphoribosyltransferase
MAEFCPDNRLSAEILDPNQKVVCLNMARAGIVPSHTCFNLLAHVLNPDGLRQDHIWGSRVVDSKEKVVGTNLEGAKIGGGIADAYVLIPDPMGATGSSLSAIVNHYKNNVEGPAKKFIAIHLIITPNYIKKLKSEHPDITIYSLRLDRGLSTEKALDHPPGTHWDEENGLNERDYIVPGAGGVGEILNNSFV